MVGINRGRQLSAADEIALKRLAIQIAAQLPDDTDHANAVLDFTRELVGGFLSVTGSKARSNPPIVLVKS
jgi:hypothetical protein